MDTHSGATHLSSSVALHDDGVCYRGRDNTPVHHCHMPFRYGDKWWVSDPLEYSATSRRSQGLPQFAAYIASAALASLFALAYHPRSCTSTLDSYGARTEAVSFGALFAYRAASALLVIAVFATRCMHHELHDAETLDGRVMHLVSHGLWHFQSFTQWQYLLSGVYFALAAAVQVQGGVLGRAALLQSPSDRPIAPSLLACSADTVLGVATSSALLTTVAVTFVLVPSKVRRGLPTTKYFRRASLIMHNFSSFSLIVDQLLSNQKVALADLPYAVLFLCVYATYHSFIRYPATRTVLYFFLNWQHPRFRLRLVSVVAALALCFAVAVGVSELRSYRWGAVLAVGCGLFIMRIRDPSAA